VELTRLRTGWHVVAAAAGTGAVVVLLASAGFDEAGAALAALDPRTFGAAALLELLAVVSLVQVYRVTFRVTGGRIGRRDGAVLGLGAVSLTQLIPGGGVAGGIFAARRFVRAGADPVAAAATVVLVGAVMLGTLGVLVAGAATVGAVSAPGYALHAVAAGLVVALMVVAVAVLRGVLGHDRTRHRVATWLGRRRRAAPLARSLAENLEAHRDLLRRPLVLAPSTGWAAVKWTADLTVLAVLVHAAGGQVPLLAVVLAYAVANLLNGLPLTPGGIGVVELGATGTLVAFGADPAVASVSVLGYRALAVGLPLLLAVPVVGRDLRRTRQRRIALQVTA
jgi:putative heme transporter